MSADALPLTLLIIFAEFTIGGLWVLWLADLRGAAAASFVKFGAGLVGREGDAGAGGSQAAGRLADEHHPRGQRAVGGAEDVDVIHLRAGEAGACGSGQPPEGGARLGVGQGGGGHRSGSVWDRRAFVRGKRGNTTAH